MSILIFLKPIPDCPDYFASDEGEIYSLKSGTLVQRKINENTKYPRISFKNKGSQKSGTVHSFIAKAWLPNPNNLPTVNHKDGDTKNNKVENLEWASFSDQNNHVEKNKMRKAHARKVNKVLSNGDVEEYKSLKEAEEKTGISFKNIHLVCSGKTRTAGGFVWYYKEKYANQSPRPHKNAVSVDQYDISGKYIRTFESATQAAKDLGCSQSVVSAACREEQKTAAGFIWKFSPVKKQIDRLSNETKTWKVVEKFPYYKISQDGRVYSIRQHKILKTWITDGREHIKLTDIQGKHVHMTIHRLVALTYMPNPRKYPQVNHISGKLVNGKLDNNLNNLEWCSKSQNIRHAHDTGLIKQKKAVHKLDNHGRILETYCSISDAKKCNACKGGINNVLAGRAKTAGGFRWKYA